MKHRFLAFASFFLIGYATAWAAAVAIAHSNQAALLTVAAVSTIISAMLSAIFTIALE